MTPDFVGRCIDTAIPLTVGLIGLVYYPRRIRKEVESGKWTEAEGKHRIIRFKIACFLFILLGVLMLSKFFK
jgi:hypothetical protein